MAILRRLLQYFLGGVLLLTGLGKMIDIQGFIQVLKTYQALPEILLVPTAVLTTLTELKLAEFILRGRCLKQAAKFSVFLHCLFTAWATMTLLRGVEVPNCGCFGVFMARPLTWTTVGEDLFMVAVSLALFFLAPEDKSSCETAC